MIESLSQPRPNAAPNALPLVADYYPIRKIGNTSLRALQAGPMPNSALPEFREVVLLHNTDVSAAITPNRQPQWFERDYLAQLQQGLQTLESHDYIRINEVLTTVLGSRRTVGSVAIDARAMFNYPEYPGWPLLLAYTASPSQLAWVTRVVQEATVNDRSRTLVEQSLGEAYTKMNEVIANPWQKGISARLTGALRAVRLGWVQTGHALHPQLLHSAAAVIPRPERPGILLRPDCTPGHYVMARLSLVYGGFSNPTLRQAAIAEIASRIADDPLPYERFQTPHGRIMSILAIWGTDIPQLTRCFAAGPDPGANQSLLFNALSERMGFDTQALFEGLHRAPGSTPRTVADMLATVHQALPKTEVEHHTSPKNQARAEAALRTDIRASLAGLAKACYHTAPTLSDALFACLQQAGIPTSRGA